MFHDYIAEQNMWELQNAERAKKRSDLHKLLITDGEILNFPPLVPFHTMNPTTADLQSELNYERTDFRGVNFSGLQIRRNYEVCNFSGCDFSNSNMLRATFLFCSFDNCNFTGSTIKDSYFEYSTFNKANFTGAIIATSVFNHNYNLDTAIFKNATITGVQGLDGVKGLAKKNPGRLSFRLR